MNDELKSILAKVQNGTLSPEEQNKLMSFAREELEKLKQDKPEDYLEFQRLVYEGFVELTKLSEKQ